MTTSTTIRGSTDHETDDDDDDDTMAITTGGGGSLLRFVSGFSSSIVVHHHYKTDRMGKMMRRRRWTSRSPTTRSFLRESTTLDNESNDGMESSNDNVDGNYYNYEDDHIEEEIAYNHDDDDDYDDTLSLSSSSCLPPGRSPEIKLVFLVSDATGVTARSTLLKSLAQFNTCADEQQSSSSQSSSSSSSIIRGTCDVRTRTFTFIRSQQALQQILLTASTKQACVLYTLADPKLRHYAATECQRLAALSHDANNNNNNKLWYVDLMGPTLDVLSSYLDEEPVGLPQRLNPQTRTRSYLGDSYYERIHAVEFALKADDGQSPWLLGEADIVIVGVSRSGKTPLSVVMSQTMSLKVANIPLVVEVPPPKQLLTEVDPRRVFCLTISPSELRKIRTNRLENSVYGGGSGSKDTDPRQTDKERDNNKNNNDSGIVLPKSTYADRSYLLRDLANARSLCEEYGWTEIDVTGRAVEETTTYIVEIFNQRFGQNDDQQQDDESQEAQEEDHP